MGFRFRFNKAVIDDFNDFIAITTADNSIFFSICVFSFFSFLILSKCVTHDLKEEAIQICLRVLAIVYDASTFSFE